MGLFKDVFMATMCLISFTVELNGFEYFQQGMLNKIIKTLSKNQYSVTLLLSAAFYVTLTNTCTVNLELFFCVFINSCS